MYTLTIINKSLNQKKVYFTYNNNLKIAMGLIRMLGWGECQVNFEFSPGPKGSGMVAMSETL